MKLSLEAIQVIDAIARGGSFSAAAERLNKVPSTISYTVSKLEEQLDIALFERNGPRVSLSRAGQELLKEGRWLLAAASDLESRLRHIATGYESELCLVLDSIIPAATIASDIQAFAELDCGTRLRLQSEVMTGSWEALREGRADLALAVGDPPPGGGYEAHALGQISFGFYIAPRHPLAQQTEPLTRDQLLAHCAIATADSARALPTRTAGLLSGQQRLTVADLASKLAFQIAGLGHGFLPKSWAEIAVARRQLVERRVENTKTNETVWLAWRAGAQGAGLQWWRERFTTQRLTEVLARIPGTVG